MPIPGTGIKDPGPALRCGPNCVCLCSRQVGVGKGGGNNAGSSGATQVPVCGRPQQREDQPEGWTQVAHLGVFGFGGHARNTVCTDGQGCLSTPGEVQNQYRFLASNPLSPGQVAPSGQGVPGNTHGPPWAPLLHLQVQDAGGPAVRVFPGLSPLTPAHCPRTYTGWSPGWGGTPTWY